jgi:hypothetical protein
MKSRKLQLAQLMAAGAIACLSCGANAGIYESYLEYSAVSVFGGNLTSNTPPYFGKVTLTEGGAGTSAYVDVHVELFSGFSFIDSGNGANHTSFAFNLTAPNVAQVTALSSPWTMNATNPSANNPFGAYTTGLDCCVSNGAAGAIAGPLDFKVISDNGVTFQGAGDHFTSNALGTFGPYTGGWWFSADLLGPDGQTGPVAARDLVPVPGTTRSTDIPEPATYTMLLASLGIMRFTQRRRKQSKS